MNQLVTEARALCKGIWPADGYNPIVARSRELNMEMAAEIERLQAELDALKADIEAGRLVRLPYSFGQEVWYTGMRPYKSVDKFTIESFGVFDDGITAWIFPVESEPFSAEVILAGEDSEVGKTVFLTEAEALAAMKEGENG